MEELISNFNHYQSNGTTNDPEDVSNSHIRISASALFIVMSYFISVLGAFTAFQMIHETRYATSRIKRMIFVICASVSMSLCAIWSMHFVGTVCFTHKHDGQQLNISYNIPITVVSAIVPFVACLLGFCCTTIQQFIPKSRLILNSPLLACFPGSNMFTTTESTSQDVATNIDLEDPVVSKKSQTRMKKLKRFLIASIIGDEFRPHILQILVGALFASAGICVMHYLGMLATQVHGTVRVFNPGVIIASVIIAYVASCAALWIAFAVQNEYQQILSSLVAGIAVSGMHYTGMASVTYHHSSKARALPGASMSNYDITMIISMLTSGTCFLMLIISSFSSRKRSSDLRKSVRVIEHEKKKVQRSVEQLNDLFSRMALEEHLTRRILNLISDGVCVIDRRGQIVKANNAFDRICAVPNAETRGDIQQYVVGISDVEKDLFSQAEAEESQITIRHAFSRSEKMLNMRRTVASDAGQYCILVIEEDSGNMIPSKSRSSIPETEFNRVSMLDQSLKNPEFLSRFKVFCELEMCGENLEFLERTQEYKQCPNVLERVEIQQDILLTFVEPGSKKQLNLPLHTLTQSVNLIEQAYGQIDLFDSLEKQVKANLADSYFRFTRT